MYNKIFTKILDSSIWLEPDATRIVWITMIAAMDETGFCHFAAIANLARRANVSLRAAKEAVKILEAPDKESGDPEFEGRRIERVDGGWLVLNAEKYRNIVTKVGAQEANRKRVARFRENKRVRNKRNGEVITGNAPVMQSEAYAEAVKPPTPFERELRTSLAPSPESLAARIADRTGLLTDGARKVLIAVCRRDLHGGVDPELIVSEMSQAWADYQRAGPELAITFGAEKFFGEGKWKDRESWGWRNNGTTKTGQSLDAAREAIRRIEVEADRRAAGDFGDPQTGEARPGGLPGLRG
jgi:hypothetical protein